MESMVIDPGFWKDREVLLTGQTGFKGGWMSLWLDQLGAKVTGYALSPPERSFCSIASVDEIVTDHVRGDIRDLPLLTDALQTTKPEIVIHMAAQSLVGAAYADPVSTFSTNVMGTVNILEAARATPSVKAVVNITSDKCYENENRREGYHEDDAMGGHDPYSASKGCSELVTAAYRKSFFESTGISIATARAGNVIGGGDWAKGRIVPDAVRAFASQQTLLIRNPVSVRPWQHVLEPLSGYLMLCQALLRDPETFSEGWNFGPSMEETHTVSDLANSLTRGWGKNATWKTEESNHPPEAAYLTLNSAKAKSQLQWSPKWNFERSVDNTMKWYKAWQANADMRAFTQQQIAAYQAEQIDP